MVKRRLSIKSLMEVLIELPTPTLMLYIINTNVHTGYLLEFLLLVSWEFLCVFGFVPSNLCGSCCPSSTFKSYIYFFHLQQFNVYLAAGFCLPVQRMGRKFKKFGLGFKV